MITCAYRRDCNINFYNFLWDVISHRYTHTHYISYLIYKYFNRLRGHFSSTSKKSYLIWSVNDMVWRVHWSHKLMAPFMCVHICMLWLLEFRWANFSIGKIHVSKEEPSLELLLHARWFCVNLKTKLNANNIYLFRRKMHVACLVSFNRFNRMGIIQTWNTRSVHTIHIVYLYNSVSMLGMNTQKYSVCWNHHHWSFQLLVLRANQ